MIDRPYNMAAMRRRLAVIVIALAVAWVLYLGPRRTPSSRFR
jgi:hypothetical protein